MYNDDLLDREKANQIAYIDVHISTSRIILSCATIYVHKQQIRSGIDEKFQCGDICSIRKIERS